MSNELPTGQRRNRYRERLWNEEREEELDLLVTLKDRPIVVPLPDAEAPATLNVDITVKPCKRRPDRRRVTKKGLNYLPDDAATWSKCRWKNTHRLGLKQGGGLPTYNIADLQDMPHAYRIALSPRHVYVAQQAARDKGLELREVFERACYHAMHLLGVQFDSEMENMDLLFRAGQIQDPAYHRVQFKDAYVDRHEMPLTAVSEWHIPTRESAEIPDVVEKELQLDRYVHALARLRAHKRYKSVYRGVVLDDETIKQELRAVLRILPTRDGHEILLDDRDTDAVLRMYIQSCKQELDTLIQISNTPMVPSKRAGVIAKAQRGAALDRENKMLIEYGFRPRDGARVTASELSCCDVEPWVDTHVPPPFSTLVQECNSIVYPDVATCAALDLMGVYVSATWKIRELGNAYLTRILQQLENQDGKWRRHRARNNSRITKNYRRCKVRAMWTKIPVYEVVRPLSVRRLRDELMIEPEMEYLCPPANVPRWYATNPYTTTKRDPNVHTQES